MAPSLKPAYLLHGDDHAKLAERRANLRSLAGRIGADVEVLEGDASTPDAAAGAIGALTLVGGRRVIIVDDVQRWKEKELADRLLPAIAQLDPETTIAFFAREEGKAKASAALEKAVAKAGGDVVKVMLPPAKDLTGWVVREAQQKGIELDREAADLVATRTGRRPARLARTLEVLALGVGTEQGRLGAQDVAPFVGDDAELTAWPLVDALVAGREQVALRMMLELQERGESTAGLLALVERRAREVRDLALRLAAGESRKDVEASLKGAPWMKSRRVQEAARADRGWLDALVARLGSLEIDTRGGSAADPAALVIRTLFRDMPAAG